MDRDRHSISLRGHHPSVLQALTDQLRLIRDVSGAMGAGVVRRLGEQRYVIEALTMDRVLLREGEEIVVDGARELPTLGAAAHRVGRIESGIFTFAPLHGLVLIPFGPDRSDSLATLVFSAHDLAASDEVLFVAARSLETLLYAVVDLDDELQRLQGVLTQAEYFSDRDPLTGALNRRGFLQALRQLEERWRYTATTYAVIIADLDHLKRVNDTLGHAAGDALLKRFVEAVRGNVRGGECLGRLGGDEFALVVELRHPRDAQLLVDRLRAALEHEGIEASWGAASHDTPSRLEELLVSADRAMYQDKVRRRLAGGQPGDARPRSEGDQARLFDEPNLVR